ncbi:MAG: CPBP family intramembrane metalloprotease [Kouleothrix sp.]|nr:CPBP family intramembrane metalloprotease [Kouleothrix sp.]
MSTLISSSRPDQIQAPARGATWLQRHPLLAFFALTFGMTWPFLIADALGSRGLLPFRVPLLVMPLVGYMPSFAALIVVGATAGRPEMRALLSRLLIWRVGLRWYAVAIAGPAVVSLGASALANLIGGAPAASLLSPRVVGMPALAVAGNAVLLFVVSALINGEELGWRGFALPRLQARHSALTASLILGVVWALFHLPLFWTIGGSSQVDMSLPGYVLQLGAMSVIVTWIFNHTRGSVLIATLLHASINTWTQIFAVDHAGPLVFWTQTGLTCLIAVVVVVVFGPWRLSR